jgi:phosphoserine phosphatase RsbU/P
VEKNMSMRNGFTHFNERLADLASRFEEKTEAWSSREEGTHPGGGWRTVCRNLHDLFTRDVTSEGLRSLIHQETRDTYRFFTRNINYESLRPLPWFKRYPLLFWCLFKEMAYRLSPPRRIAFAVAIFLFLLGIIQALSFTVQKAGGDTVMVRTGGGGSWWLMSILLLLFLLLMELRDKLDLKRDLTIAREIQFGLVPAELFQKNNIQIQCRMRPANTVGGDYYDIISQTDPNRIVLVIGDVAGKGMPAALLMALLQGSLRTLNTAGFRGSSLMTKLNEYLCSSIPSDRLVTLFYAELDTMSGILEYVNAGHNPPLLLRQNGEIEKLDATALVLGVLKDKLYESRTIQLSPGDLLMLYTDGITEAFNPKEEEYGLERLAHFLKAGVGALPGELIPKLFEDVLKFCDTARPTDDMTAVAVLCSGAAVG